MTFIKFLTVMSSILFVTFWFVCLFLRYKKAKSEHCQNTIIETIQKYILEFISHNAHAWVV